MFVSTCGGSSARPSLSRHRGGEELRLGVVLGQPLDVMLQGVQGAGRDDAGLPHAAAEHFAMTAGAMITSSEPTIAEPTGAPSPLLKQTLTVSKCSAHRRPEMPLATTALKSRAPSRCRASLRRLGPLAHRDDAFVRQHPAGAAVVRVLQAHQPRERVVNIVAANLVLEVRQRQHAVVACRPCGPRCRTTGRRRPARSCRCGSPRRRETRRPAGSGAARRSDCPSCPTERTTRLACRAWRR